MTWTTEVPKAPGLYQARKCGVSDILLEMLIDVSFACLRWKGIDGLAIIDSGKLSNENWWWSGMEWYGPLEAPEDTP